MNFTAFFAWRTTFRNSQAFSRLAASIAIASIALSVAVMLVTVSLVEGFRGEISRKITGFDSPVQVVPYNFDFEDSTEFISATNAMVLTLPKVDASISAISPFILKHGIIKSVHGLEGVVFRGVDRGWDSTFMASQIVSGRLPVLPDSGYGLEVMVSRRLANLLELQAGSDAKIYFLEREKVRMRKVRIAGLFNTGLDEFDRSAIFCDIRLLQRILGWHQGQAMGFNISRTEIPDSVQMQRINEALGYDLVALSILERHETLFHWLGLQQQNETFVLALMTLVAIINMAAAILILITERTKTIGLLKAIGATDWQVQKIFLWNTLFLAAAGTLLGDVLGLGLLGIQELFQPVQLEQDTYFVKEIPVAWEWLQFLLINIGVLLVCSASMLLPTIAIQRVMPNRILRFE